MSPSHKTSSQILGKTIRLTWTEGPTQGTTNEHVFHEDGTVEWRTLDDHKKPEPPGATLDRPTYLARDIAEHAVLVSYLSSAGYTLTVALDFRNQTTVGVASNEKTWTGVEGTFAVVHPPALAIGNAQGQG